MERIITVVEETDEVFESFLENQIKNFNNAESPHHRESRKPGALHPLNIILQDRSGTTIGGLSARTYWGWLDIENLYIPSNLRGEGIGSRILKKAEDIALARGCRWAHLTTYEYQARRFYERHGWRVVGTLEDYPPGSSYHWMRKDFRSTATESED